MSADKSAIGDGVRGPACSAPAPSVRQAYDATAMLLRHARHSRALREEDQTTQLHRATVAFVKTCLLDAAVGADSTPPAGFVLADIACGRGQDVPKLAHAVRNTGKKCRGAHFVDISPPCLEAAQAMVLKFLGEHTAAECTYTEGDAGSPSASWASPRVPVDIVVCHLALHYWCDAEARITAFFKHTASMSGPEACLVLSFADGRWVVRAARDALAGRQVATGSPSPADVQVCVPRASVSPMFSLHVPVHLLGRCTPGPWNLRYHFQMGSGARVAAPECLVHEGALLQVAHRAGWQQVAFSARFDEAAAMFARVPRFAAFGEVMGALPLQPAAMHTAAMYRCVVLTKTGTAKAAVAARVHGTAA